MKRSRLHAPAFANELVGRGAAEGLQAAAGRVIPKWGHTAPGRVIGTDRFSRRGGRKNRLLHSAMLNGNTFMPCASGTEGFSCPSARATSLRRGSPKSRPARA